MNLTIPKFKTRMDRATSFFTATAGIIPLETAQQIVEETDFLTAPASTHYHGAYEGGLYDHSFATMMALRHLTDTLSLKWEDPTSPVKVGLFHDFCKLGSYKKSLDGSYFYNTEQLFSGHGTKSVIKTLEYMSLNLEETACITYHMGAFTDKSEWEYYSRAIKQFPNVLFTHTADMIASKILEV